MPKDKGFLERPVQEKDYIAGKSPIIHEDRIFDSNWSDYTTDYELQKQNGFEPMDCVTQAIINSIQAQIQWFLDTGKLPERIKTFLFNNNCIVEGKLQFSKKFIAILSETTPLGNYLTKVAQTVREVGVISEAMLPISGKTWDEFYDTGQITDEMREFGKMLFDKDNDNAFFTLQYEWVVTPNDGGLLEEQRAKMLHALRHAPLVIAKSGHCTLKMLGVSKVKWQIVDSYKPFIKDRAWDYNALWVLKVIVDLKINDKKMKLVKTEDKPHIYLIVGNKKIMLIDVPTLNALEENYTTISPEEMDRYEDGGTLIWADRIIN